MTSIELNTIEKCLCHSLLIIILAQVPVLVLVILYNNVWEAPFGSLSSQDVCTVCMCVLLVYMHS